MSEAPLDRFDSLVSPLPAGQRKAARQVLDALDKAARHAGMNNRDFSTAARGWVDNIVAGMDPSDPNALRGTGFDTDEFRDAFDDVYAARLRAQPSEQFPTLEDFTDELERVLKTKVKSEAKPITQEKADVLVLHVEELYELIGERVGWWERRGHRSILRSVGITDKDVAMIETWMSGQLTEAEEKFIIEKFLATQPQPVKKSWFAWRASKESLPDFKTMTGEQLKVWVEGQGFDNLRKLDKATLGKIIQSKAFDEELSPDSSAFSMIHLAWGEKNKK